MVSFFGSIWFARSCVSLEIDALIKFLTVLIMQSFNAYLALIHDLGLQRIFLVDILPYISPNWKKFSCQMLWT
jgi:hypothetical protein